MFIDIVVAVLWNFCVAFDLAIASDGCLLCLVQKWEAFKSCASAYIARTLISFVVSPLFPYIISVDLISTSRNFNLCQIGREVLVKNYLQCVWIRFSWTQKGKKYVSQCRFPKTSKVKLLANGNFERDFVQRKF